MAILTDRPVGTVEDVFRIRLHPRGRAGGWGEAETEDGVVEQSLDLERFRKGMEGGEITRWTAIDDSGQSRLALSLSSRPYMADDRGY